MALSKFRRIVSGSLAAVMLLSAGAAAVAKDETVPAEISGTYQFQEVGTISDLVNRIAEPVLKSIGQYLNSENSDHNIMSKIIQTMLQNDMAHNEAHKDRTRTDMFYFNEDWFKGDATDEKPLADGTTLVTVVPDASSDAAAWIDNLDIGSNGG